MAKKLGLSYERPYNRSRWKDFANIETSIRDFILAQNMGDRMPTYTERVDAGEVALANAIKRSG